MNQLHITKREVLRAFSINELTAINFLNKILIPKEDQEFIEFLNIMNNITYKSEVIAQIISDKNNFEII